MPAAWNTAAEQVRLALVGTVDTAGGTLARKYFLDTDLEDLTAGNPLVTVFARSDDISLQRAIAPHEIEVRVLVEQRVESDAEADTASELIESLVNALVDYRANFAAANVGLNGIKVEPLYAPGMLREKKIFQSVLVVSLQMNVRYA